MTALIVMGILLILAIGVSIIAGIAHWKRGDDLIKDIEEWEKRSRK